METTDLTLRALRAIKNKGASPERHHIVVAPDTLGAIRLDHMANGAGGFFTAAGETWLGFKIRAGTHVPVGEIWLEPIRGA